MTRRGEFLWGIVCEGAIDAFCGRPREHNPYDPTLHAAEAWFYGWDEGRWLLELRGQEEAARWLREAA
ncbi:MAG TPA: hypothetical protein VEY87_08065 [Gaiellaceae bacterium]|jgi:hypothetical protein|nr:hypothetical protein [Gaiellaceae bacterium]